MPTTDNRRGAAQIRHFSEAMIQEAQNNAHKGDWSEHKPNSLWCPADVDPHVWEIVYHAVKLGLAIQAGHEQAILEYAADVANHAWMAADTNGALDSEPQEGHVEYAELAFGGELPGWKQKVGEWMRELFPAEGQT